MSEARTDKLSVSALQIIGKGLGIFWLIDGLLQLQPKMFGMDFVNNVLLPNLTASRLFCTP